MEINILIEDEFKGRLTKRRITEIVKQVLAAEKTSENTELGVLITTQENIHELNRAYRGKDKPTDVLSFFMIEGEKPQDDPEIFITAPDNIRHLGEVIISYPQALLQARERKHTVKEEITILLIHGVLHLLGYDHEESEAEEKRMKARENKILMRLIENKG
jgi:probable rRNA maturation factor